MTGIRLRGCCKKELCTCANSLETKRDSVCERVYSLDSNTSRAHIRLPDVEMKLLFVFLSSLGPVCKIFAFENEQILVDLHLSNSICISICFTN